MEDFPTAPFPTITTLIAISKSSSWRSRKYIFTSSRLFAPSLGIHENRNRGGGRQMFVIVHFEFPSL